MIYLQDKTIIITMMLDPGNFKFKKNYFNIFSWYELNIL